MFFLHWKNFLNVHRFAWNLTIFPKYFKLLKISSLPFFISNFVIFSRTKKCQQNDNAKNRKKPAPPTHLFTTKYKKINKSTLYVESWYYSLYWLVTMVIMLIMMSYDRSRPLVVLLNHFFPPLLIFPYIILHRLFL